jgi:hypothetical protein
MLNPLARMPAGYSSGSRIDTLKPPSSPVMLIKLLYSSVTHLNFSLMFFSLIFYFFQTFF